MTAMLFAPNTRKKTPPHGADLADFGPAAVTRVRRFLESFPEYAPTPLVPLPGLARRLGVGGIFLKDESRRFGLNAFKVLGGAYAVGNILARRLGRPLEELGAAALRDAAARGELGDITLATATDGNHGRGVAWAARQFGLKARVYMPKGSAEIRARNIRAEGAECCVTDLNYDDAVRLANADAEKGGWIMVQDTAWEGYEEIPRWIMQGYTALAAEAHGQLHAAGAPEPDQILLQAGVGSFAGAAAGYFAANLKKLPTITLVEPHDANCLYLSMKAGDGLPHTKTGDLATLMAGLACGEPSTISWPVLRDYCAGAISCSDYIAANGMRLLAAASDGDSPVVSGESGAATCGALDYLMREEGRAIRETLGLGPDSQVLLVSTEGDTSPTLYDDIVRYGRYPDPSRS